MYIELQSNIALIKALLHVKIPGKTTDVRENEMNLGKDVRAPACSMKKLNSWREWFDYFTMLQINNTRIVWGHWLESPFFSWIFANKTLLWHMKSVNWKVLDKIDQ